MKQNVKITTPVGTITLSSESHYSQNNTNRLGNIELNNVPIKYNYSQDY